MTRKKTARPRSQHQGRPIQVLTDEEAYHHYERLILKISSRAHRLARSRGVRVSLEDIVQTAWLGFFHAKRKWNPDRGANLCTYCVIFARGHIQRFIWGTKKTVQKRWEDGAKPVDGTYFHDQESRTLDEKCNLGTYLESLEDTAADVVTLAVFRDYSAGKIARIQGMLVGDVVQILQDARQHLGDFEK